jgi:uncharacterized protein (TIGR00730 family)
MPALRSVTLYCSSSRSLDPHFAVAARAAGALLAARGITLVYGGGGLGLMGEAARACKAAGGRVEGIITRKFLDLEQGWLGCDELVVVDTMRERKRILIERADAFLVLPGGMGTFEEFFETLVGRQIGDHEKPIAVLDDHGYYLPLQSLIEHSIREKFAREALREVLHFGTDLPALLDWLQESVRAPVRADPARFLPMGPNPGAAPA